MKPHHVLIIALLLLSLLLLGHCANGQSQTFTLLRLADRYGLENRQEETKVSLLPGFVQVTGKGQTWREEISFQTKGGHVTQATTVAGEYTFVFDGATLVAVHLRSVAGADRSYLNPIK